MHLFVLKLNSINNISLIFHVMRKKEIEINQNLTCVHVHVYMCQYAVNLFYSNIWKLIKYILNYIKFIR